MDPIKYAALKNELVKPKTIYLIREDGTMEPCIRTHFKRVHTGNYYTTGWGEYIENIYYKPRRFYYTRIMNREGLGNVLKYIIDNDDLFKPNYTYSGNSIRAIYYWQDCEDKARLGKWGGDYIFEFVTKDIKMYGCWRGRPDSYSAAVETKMYISTSLEPLFKLVKQPL